MIYILIIPCVKKKNLYTVIGKMQHNLWFIVNQNYLRKMKSIEFTYILSYFEVIVNANVVKTY